MTILQSPNNVSKLEDTRRIVEDLFAPKVRIFWFDLLISTAVGWSAFVLACLAKPLSWQMYGSCAICAIALYRALSFMHELSHIRTKALPGFAQVWNIIVGIPLLFPYFLYLDVHADHHRLSTYGTKNDPEYLPIAGSRLEIFLFTAHSILIPALLMLRFLVLAPLGLLFPPLHRFLEEHASSLTMNFAYSRKVSDAERSQIIAIELLILGIWGNFFVLARQGLVPWRILAIWYGILACISLINVLRTLGAHRYQHHNGTLERVGQLLDSINTPGAFWTEIWAPVGLRYHALHHYFPSIPYHNLPIAHKRLIQVLPPDAPYCLTTSSSLWHSLQTLWSDKGANSERHRA